VIVRSNWPRRERGLRARLANAQAEVTALHERRRGGDGAPTRMPCGEAVDTLLTRYECTACCTSGIRNNSGSATTALWWPGRHRQLAWTARCRLPRPGGMAAAVRQLAGGCMALRNHQTRCPCRSLLCVPQRIPGRAGRWPPQKAGRCPDPDVFGADDHATGLIDWCRWGCGS